MIDFFPSTDCHRFSRNTPSCVPSYSRYVGCFSASTWRVGTDADLIALDGFDQSLISHLNLKPSERVYRYVTDNMVSGTTLLFSPLIKINLDNSRVYFLTEEASMGEVPVAFERKGYKIRWIRLQDTEQ